MMIRIMENRFSLTDVNRCLPLLTSLYSFRVPGHDNKLFSVYKLKISYVDVITHVGLSTLAVPSKTLFILLLAPWQARVFLINR